ncbi:MAG: iron-containing alcohol dehydrogenase [Halieaceae bacterium]|jgi:alcohol dehydrogenase class IV|nr:iron-containing alcohol dehydrogenase [Halieaceae bacterium]
MSLPHTNWHYPTRMWFGDDRLQELPTACRSLGLTRPLLVTDRGLAELDFVNRARELLADAGLGEAFHGDVDGNPAGRHVDSGVTAFLAGDCDGVIGLGGGSALDAAKSIALVARQSRPLWDFEDVGDNWRRAEADAIAPVIAIPTTAGTGSEVGRAAVILDEATRTKKIIFHPAMMPALVISDPTLTVGLPPNITAWTGVDAFVHALEAWCAPGFHPMAEGIALEAMRMVRRWLPQAVADGSNLQARGQMLVAASMGATAFQKGLGSIHSVSHVLGARYGLHHGLANAVILPYGLARNARYLEPRMPALCQALGIDGTDTADLVEELLAFRASLEIPENLAALDVPDEDAAGIGAAALADPSTTTNAGPMTAEDFEALFRDARHGELHFT